MIMNPPLLFMKIQIVGVWSTNTAGVVSFHLAYLLCIPLNLDDHGGKENDSELQRVAF